MYFRRRLILDRLNIGLLDRLNIGLLGRVNIGLHPNVGLFLYIALHLGTRLGTLGNSLGETIQNNPILDRPLDHPVAISATFRLDTVGAQVIVTILTNAAVVVLVGNGSAAAVAVDVEG